MSQMTEQQQIEMAAEKYAVKNEEATLNVERIKVAVKFGAAEAFRIRDLQMKEMQAEIDRLNAKYDFQPLVKRSEALEAENQRLREANQRMKKELLRVVCADNGLINDQCQIATEALSVERRFDAALKDPGGV